MPIPRTNGLRVTQVWLPKLQRVFPSFLSVSITTANMFVEQERVAGLLMPALI